MESKLTQKDIARFTPHGLKYTFNGKEYECNGLINHIGWCVSTEDDTGRTFRPVSNIKPILRHINTLTQEQWLEGYDEPVYPIVELAKIAFPYDGCFEIFKDDEGCFASGDTIDFFYKNGNFRAENLSDIENVVNQTALLEWLETHKFNAWGIPDELVKYVTEDFNPYKK